MQSCLESIESCTQNIVRFNERMDQKRVQAEAQRRESADPPAARKAIIPLVFVILSWVFLAYVWRLCSRLIQQNPQGAVLGSRADGIGLLVAFVIMWLMTMWSYVTVISKGPGLVKDYVPESDPPPASFHPGQWNGAPQQPSQQHYYPQNASGPMPIPGQARFSTEEPSMRASESAHGHIAPAASTSLPYPSFNADLERFGGLRASSDSMRVLPGSVEPKHDGDLSHSRDMSRCTIVEEEAAAYTSAADLDAELVTERSAAKEDIRPSGISADPQLPGIIGSFGAAAIAEGEGAREGAEDSDQAEAQQQAPQPFPPATNDPIASGWAAPQRRPQNDPPPLSPAALYCHRCRRVKPPRAHHCRRCGTCVLKMDHHCPWVGGCVGAHNQRFFFIFVFWVTMLELYTLITTAIFFHRGIRSLSSAGGTSAWKVDGFLISLFPICAIFLIFTGALLCTHVFLMSHNMTTIEHVGISKVQGRERVLIDRWFGVQSKKGGQGKGGFGGLNLKAKREMVREWDAEWGKLSKEGNRWWLGSSREVRYPRHEQDQQREQQQQEHELQEGPSSDAISINGAHEKQQGVSFNNQKKKNNIKTKKSGTKEGEKGAWMINMEQALGSNMVLWFVPVGKHPNDGLDFPMNPRFGDEGVWRKRQEWPSDLR